MNEIEMRKDIDTIDEQILKLFLDRMDLSETLAKQRDESELPIIDKTREREELARVTAAAGDKDLYVYQLYSTIFELTKALQNKQNKKLTQVQTQVEKALAAGSQVFPKTGSIAVQGVEGANSQQACDKLFPRGNIMYFSSFSAVFDAVESGLCKFGVLPIENSTNGSVRAVYELLRRRKFSIVRTTKLWIRHELLAKPGTDLSAIKTIYSHEQAIGQCSKFLSTLKGVNIVPCANTAMAAKAVAEGKDQNAAAIASPICSELYSLEKITDSIQDSDNNYTRFVCIMKEPMIYAGANRMSLIVSTGNKPGMLYRVLSRPAALGINMTKLESCPQAGSDFQFVFFIELEASAHEPEVLAMLEDLERSCDYFSFLGSYMEI